MKKRCTSNNVRKSIPVIQRNNERVVKRPTDVALFFSLPLLVAILGISFWYFWMTDFADFGSQIGHNRRLQNKLSDEEVVQRYGHQMDECGDDLDCLGKLPIEYSRQLNSKCIHSKCIYRIKE